MRRLCACPSLPREGKTDLPGWVSVHFCACHYNVWFPNKLNCLFKAMQSLVIVCFAYLKVPLTQTELKSTWLTVLKKVEAERQVSAASVMKRCDLL